MWENLQKTADIVTLTEEILNGKLYLLCDDRGIGIHQLLMYFSHKNCNFLITFCQPICPQTMLNDSHWNKLHNFYWDLPG